MTERRIIEIAQINSEFMSAEFNDNKRRLTVLYAGLQSLARQVELRMNEETRVVFDDNVDVKVENSFCMAMASLRYELSNRGIKFPKVQE